MAVQRTTVLALVLFGWSFVAPYWYVQQYCEHPPVPCDGEGGAAVALPGVSSATAAACEPLVVAAVRAQARKCSPQQSKLQGETAQAAANAPKKIAASAVAAKPGKPAENPLDLDALEAKISKAKEELSKLANAIDNEPAINPSDGHRRAAVVFQDDSSHLDQLKWFLYSWHAVGLDTPEAAFDVVVFADPKVIAKLPSECKGVPDNQDTLPMDDSLPGRCLYQPLVGISHTEPLYSGQHAFNSLQCLADPKASRFLNFYRLLLRTDLDTFLTPKMVDWWPKELQVRDMQGYAYNQDVRNKLALAAKEAGLRHVAQTDLASSWYGPARLVTQMCRLTLAAGRFLKLRLFGNNPCRWPKSARPPGIQCWDHIEMSWGTGIYEGVLLLYAQELAANHVWASKGGTPSHKTILDHATMTDSHVCVTAQLHVHHGDDRFSKSSYGVGRYNKMDLSKLDLRRIDDFATYMALVGNNHGIGDAQVALKKLGEPLRDLCRHIGSYEGTIYNILSLKRNWCIDRFSNKDLNVYGCQAGSLNQRYSYTTNHEFRIDDYHCLQPMPVGDAVEIVVGHCASSSSEEHKLHRWKRVPVGAPGQGEQIVHEATGKCMQASATEAKHIRLLPCKPAEALQLWRFRDPA